MPGYVAPADTVRPASRVTALLLRIIVEAALAGPHPDADAPGRRGSARRGRRRPDPLLPAVPAFPPRSSSASLMVWTNLFGVVSFELYGQLHNVVGEEPGDREAFFAECIRRWIHLIGIT